MQPNRENVIFNNVNSAFNGAYRSSSFVFEKFGQTLIRKTINGEEYPYKIVPELVYNNESRDRFAIWVPTFVRDHGVLSNR